MPFASHAQQGQPLRRIGILTGLDENESKIRMEPLLRELERLNWVRRTNTGLVALNATPADFKKKFAESETLALRLADFALVSMRSGRAEAG